MHVLHLSVGPSRTPISVLASRLLSSQLISLLASSEISCDEMSVGSVLKRNSSSSVSAVAATKPERLNTKFVLTEHRMAVKAAVWCSVTKTFASAGLDRDIVIWTPKDGSVVTRLVGHNKAIVDIKCLAWRQRDLLVSLDRMSDIRVWVNMDLMVHIPAHKAPEKHIGSVVIHEAADALILFDRCPHVWRFKKAEAADVTGQPRTHNSTHKQQLLDICVDSDNFQQLLCLDAQGLVTLWALGAGSQSFSLFIEAPEGADKQRPSAVSFDDSCRPAPRLN